MFTNKVLGLKIFQLPAASHSTMASLVVLVTPPRCPEFGDGRMKARGFRLNSVIRVLSPKSDPPVVPVKCNKSSGFMLVTRLRNHTFKSYNFEI